MKWTCEGSVCGDCGIMHRTLETAKRHCDSHNGAIRRGNPSTFPTYSYSDRVPVPADDEAREEEQALIDEMYE